MTLIDALVTLGLEPWPEPIAADRSALEPIALSSPHGGLATLLGAACRLGVIQPDDDAAALVERAWTERLVTVVALDAVLVGVTDTLIAAGIDHRVLKGAAVARLDEIEPSWRAYGDVDIFVRDDAFLDAVDTLSAIGLAPVHEPVRRWWAHRFAKSITLADAAGHQVDLHRRLVVGPLGERLDSDRLFADPEVFDVGGRPVAALDRVQRMAHACAHAAVSPQRSHRHRRDVVLLSRSVPRRSLDEMLDAGWPAAVLAEGLSWAGRGGGLPGDWEDWVRTCERDPTDARLVVSSRGGFREVARSTLRHLPPRDAARYLAGLLVPSRSHLASRGLSRRRHLRMLVSGDLG